MSEFDRLHPALQHHIVNSLGWGEMRPVQALAISAYLDGANLVILAPTAGGKTEAAFFPVLSQTLSESWAGLSVLYVSPIKALLNNQEHRLARYFQLVGRQAACWHGDTPQGEKRRIVAAPPDCLLSTPESLEAILVSTKIDHARFFKNVRTVIVDELHAFAADDRGWHLLSVFARIQRLAGRDIQRIGLSATVGNPEDVLAWLASGSARHRQVIWPRPSTKRAPDVQLDFVGSLPNAAKVIRLLHQGEKRLVFCDSRSRVEQLALLLREHGIDTFVSHSSLGVEERRAAEQAFASRQNCVIVATSSLELGLDVGDLDRVIQIDAPPTVSSFLQRMGRTGRRDGTTSNCLWLATTDEGLLRAAALLGLWQDGFVEPVHPPEKPYHILAQQLMALILQEKGIGQSEWFRREDGPVILVLAGRSWKTNHLDWKRRVAHVEPTDERGRSRWLGEGQMLSYRLCQSIRRILADEEQAPFWSSRATDRLEELRSKYSWASSAETSIVRHPSGEIRWWTFGGGIANALLANHLRTQIDARGDNLAIRFPATSALDSVVELVSAIVVEDVRPVPNAAAIENMKFTECLSPELAPVGLLPLVKAVRNDQAPPRPKGTAEGGLCRRRFRPGVGEAIPDGGVVRPGRDQAPAQESKLPPLGPWLLPHDGHRLTGGDVEAGKQVRRFGQGERLGHGLGRASQGKATAHARCLFGFPFPYSTRRGETPVAEPYPELEEKLRPLADPLSPPRPGDWLAEHDVPGQTFAEYLDARPVRKSDKLHTIYLCLVGDFSEAQRRILALTQDYLALFFDCPVKVQRQIALASIPARAGRTHPSWGDPQVLTGYILHEVLEPERPADALAYLALTASDLWPGRGWNFVFGEANLRQRTGVWSIYRNGDPGEDFTLCLRRTLGTASHELGHVLTIHHCTAFRCLMNGSNHQEERDARPLYLCPVCLRKLCWNLRVEPIPYLTKMMAFCRENGLDPERGWYERAMVALAT